MSPADEKLWSTLVHIGGIFFDFVAGRSSATWC